MWFCTICIPPHSLLRTTPRFCTSMFSNRFVLLFIYLPLALLWDIILSQYFFVEECTFLEYMQADWLVGCEDEAWDEECAWCWYTWCVVLHSLGAFVHPLWSWKTDVHGRSRWWWCLMVAPMVVVVVKVKPDTERENKKGLGLFAFMLILCFPQPHHAQTLRMMWTFPLLST